MFYLASFSISERGSTIHNCCSQVAQLSDSSDLARSSSAIRVCDSTVRVHRATVVCVKTNNNNNNNNNNNKYASYPDRRISSHADRRHRLWPWPLTSQGHPKWSNIVIHAVLDIFHVKTHDLVFWPFGVIQGLIWWCQLRARWSYV